MELKVKSGIKVKSLTTIFTNINKLSDDINMRFSEDGIYVQGMDPSHVSIFELSLKKDWFEMYDVSNSLVLGLKCSTLNLLFGICKDGQSVHMNYISGKDKLDISFVSDEEIEHTNHEFNIPIMDIEQEIMDIPDSGYDVVILLDSKKLCENISPFSKFGDNIEFKLGKLGLSLSSSDDTNGTINSYINSDTYNNSESKIFNINLSLKYLMSFLSFHKISKKVEMRITQDVPFRMDYILEENDPSQYIRFYLAPRMDDE
tara:strand:- start:2299 stop:3075 length:777 start_codon:yes stop_codon:yes gene_type:complete